MPKIIANNKQLLLQFSIFIGLYSFSVTHPILQIIAEDISFLIFLKIGWEGILLYWAIVAIFIPLLLFLMIQILKLVDGQLYRFTYSFFCISFAFLFFSMSMNSLVSDLNLYLFVTAVVILTSLFICLFRTQLGQITTAMFAFIILLSSWQFFLGSDVSQFFEKKANSLFPSISFENKPSVFLLVFDELPTASLLNESLFIDDRHFPNFSKLAENSHWFRNASTVSVATSSSLPAIVSGNFPEPGYRPTFKFYPNNIISLFDLNAHSNTFEEATRFKFVSHPFDSGALAWLLLDSAVVYAHMVLPMQLRSELPSVKQKKGKFLAGSEKIQLLRDLRKKLISDGEDEVNNFGTDKTRLATYERHLTKSDSGGRFQFNFFHMLFPHVPWNTTPSSKVYAPGNLFHHDRDTEYWLSNEYYVLQNYQRHLVQVSVADRLLGEFMNHLILKDMYEDSLVIVTADHGISFHAGQHRRSAELVQNPADIISVPLFVKLPGQQFGVVSDRNVETIDIAPTIADVLDIALAWPTDGGSFFDPDYSVREKKRVLSYDWGTRAHSDDRYSDEWLEYSDSQLENIKKSNRHKFQSFTLGDMNFTFDTTWSINARQQANALIENDKPIRKGTVSIDTESLSRARTYPDIFSVSRIVGEVFGVQNDATVVLKFDGIDRLEVAPLVENKFSFFFQEATYDEFVSTASILVVEDTKLLKPKVSW